MIRCLTVLTLCTVLSACGEATDPRRADGGPATDAPSTSPPPEPEVLVGTGTVLDDGDGPELCLGPVMESLPPQCGGPELIGWDWAEIPDEGTAGGTTWVDGVVVTGTFDGEAFTLTRPAVPVDQYDGPLPAEPERSLDTPCPEPPGGWRVLDPGTATMAHFEEAAAAATRLDGYADSWVDYLQPPDHSVETDGYEPDNVILNVRVVGDPAATAARLREIWGGALCVSVARRSEAELRAIHDQVLDRPGVLSSWTGFDVVELGVLYDDGSLQRSLDQEYGKGVVQVHSALVPLRDLE